MQTLVFHPICAKGNFTEESVRGLTPQLLSLDDPFTAQLAVNGDGGMGAFRTIKEMGLTHPRGCLADEFRQLSLDDIGRAQIDVIEQPVEQMADAALRSILNAASGTTVRLPQVCEDV